MDYDRRLGLDQKYQAFIWVEKISRQTRSVFTDWVSSHHPERLHCTIEPGFLYGSFNLAIKVKFDDGTAWIVRHPMPGNTARGPLSDEKLAMEVETLGLIREKTTVPVPEVKAWGLAADNPLGLGPFIMMEFVEGVSLREVLADKNLPGSSVLMRPDVSDGELEYMYRQMANITLQLFRLDFNSIGSLPNPRTGFPAPGRPLTFKAHEILVEGGVNAFGDRNKGFQTTTEFFQYLISQDWEQLHHQANSTDSPVQARASYAWLGALMPLVPDFVAKAYDKGPFKLTCDDLGLANMMVRSKDDLTIVGVVDLEWSYVGPAQLAATPWWLLQSRLSKWNVVEDTDRGVEAVMQRYLKALEAYKRFLSEEDKVFAANAVTEDGQKVEGTGGNHELQELLDCFGLTSAAPIRGSDEVEAFSVRKAAHMAQYREELSRARKLEQEMNEGKMTKEELIEALSFLRRVW